jgi:hypothetical protein
MAVKAIVFLFIYAGTCALALYTPLAGILGYIGHYHFYPETQWWGTSLARLGIRYSFVLAALTAVGAFFNRRKLSYGNTFLTRQEWFLIIFVGLAWISMLLTFPVEVGILGTQDHVVLKLIKVLIFILMLTHVVTTVKDINWLLWTIVIGTLFLGYEAFSASSGHFRSGGRLDGIGGPDFLDSNMFAAHLVACLPLVGAQFFISGRKGKITCAIAGALALNAIVLTRSRGAFLGLMSGILLATLAAPKGYRKFILAGILALAVGGYSMTDPGYIRRIATINNPKEARDFSAESRLMIWHGGLEMLADHPFGVGSGNFVSAIRRYVPYYSDTGADAHSTFVRCACELGVQGIAVYLTLFINAAYVLRSVLRRAARLPDSHGRRIVLTSYGILVSLTTFFFSGLTMTLLYIEGPYWLLAMPVCLERATAQLETELHESCPPVVASKIQGYQNDGNRHI